MNTRPSAKTAAMAAISALTLVASSAAVAQPGNGGPPPGYDNGGPPPGYGNGAPPPGYDNGGPPPPNGDYPPPPGAGSNYDQQSYSQDQQYAQAYQAWAQRYCIQQHNNNVAAGAVIGGALGAILGGGISGHAGGAALGGVLGAGAGAAVGANSGNPGNCPGGYVVADGAPPFAWVGPVIYAPGWYNPWVFEGGRYVYVPYRAYYWRHHGWDGHPHWRR
jgi:hypothetical protein